jgi:putative hemolysin
MNLKTMSFASFDFQEFIRGWDIRLSPRFWSYQPMHVIELETPLYTLKTARTMSDLLEVFSLRHRIFLEHTKGGAKSDGYDLDFFDDLCDHIIIIDKQSDSVVGTYRLLSSRETDSFYSATEFQMDEFLAMPGVKMELGRACIDFSHRNGAVIDLLWKGIAQYANWMGARYLFGCSSVKSMDCREMRTLRDYLAGESLHRNEFAIRSIDSFAVDLEEFEPYELDQIDGKRLLPPLLRSYFSAGARIYGQPAFDRDFECFDFLTILDLHDLTPSFQRRYFS